MAWQAARKATQLATLASTSRVCMYISTRLQVERITSSCASGGQKCARACARVASEKARRSRIATGAVVWFNPTTTIAMRVCSIAPRGTHSVCTKHDAGTKQQGNRRIVEQGQNNMEAEPHLLHCQWQPYWRGYGHASRGGSEESEWHNK